MLLAGAIAGLGGAYFTLGSASPFNKEMTAGAGFIALAAVIFGRWDPIRATLAALLFGFATNLQNVLSVIGSPVPSEFMLMLPYVVTIFAVAGLVGQLAGARGRRQAVHQGVTCRRQREHRHDRHRLGRPARSAGDARP